MLPNKLKIIINLNHFCPWFNSSFVDFANQPPEKNPNKRTAIPIKILKISGINRGMNRSLNNLMQISLSPHKF